MNIIPTKKMLEKIVEGKLAFKDVKRFRGGAKANLIATKVVLSMESDSNLSIKFYKGKSHLASLGPIKMYTGDTATITGIKSILEVRLS